MFVDSDIYGRYEKCLQCGHCHEPERLEEVRYSAVRKGKSAIGTI